MKRLAPAILSVVLALGLQALAQTAPPAEHGVQTTTIDPSVKPCDDFFQYANGLWLKTTKIPAEYSSWDTSTEIYERNMALLKSILDDASKDTSATKGSVRRLAGDFYASGMEEASIEKAGISPLASRLAHIKSVKTPGDLATEIGRLHLEGIVAGFAFGVGIDDKASDTPIAKLAQAGLGLPDRDYYTKEDDASKALRAKYVAHVTRMFELAGDDAATAKKNADTVMAMETSLARASMTAVEKRDPKAMYNKTTREALAKDAPGFEWAAYFEATGLPCLHLEGIWAGFAFGVGIDDKASDTPIAKLAQAGLGLPDRDYYTKEDDASKALRAKYVAHVTRMFELLGDEAAAAKKNAETVMAMETSLARASMTAVEKRDPKAMYNKTTRDALAKDAPGFEWAAYFEAAGLPESQKNLVVRQPAFIREFARMAKALPLENWKTYLRWHLIHETARYLSSPLVNENFDFYGKILSGAQELRPRWKRVMSATEEAMGEAVGQLYVEKAFSPEAKKKALDLVKNLQAALRDRITALEWMTPATKAKALKKLDTFIVKIGYPDKWRDYSKTGDRPGPVRPQRPRGQRLRVQAPAGQARQARGPHRMAHERRRRTTPTTSPSRTRSASPRASCSRPSSTPRRTTPPTTAPRVPPSATR